MQPYFECEPEDLDRILDEYNPQSSFYVEHSWENKEEINILKDLWDWFNKMEICPAIKYYDTGDSSSTSITLFRQRVDTNILLPFDTLKTWLHIQGINYYIRPMYPNKSFMMCNLFRDNNTNFQIYIWEDSVIFIDVNLRTPPFWWGCGEE